MAIYNTPDGRQIVGETPPGNDYHGFNGKRDIIIQLTADGATADGLNALEYLKAYAIEQNAQGRPIFPNGTRVFISANGYTKAVEADDVVIDGDNITIGGIVWNGSAWDYSGAGQVASSLPEVGADDNGKVLTVVNGSWAAASGGGTGGGVLVVQETLHQGETLVSGTLPNVDGYSYTSSHGEGTLHITVTGIGNKNLDEIVVTIGEKEYTGTSDLSTTGDNTLNIRLKDEQMGPESAITGLAITVAESYTALDHTWQEIHDAGFAVFNDNGNICTLLGIFGETGYYGATFYACYNGEQGVEIYNVEFSTSSASGYPARSTGR